MIGSDPCPPCWFCGSTEHVTAKHPAVLTNKQFGIALAARNAGQLTHDDLVGFFLTTAQRRSKAATAVIPVARNAIGINLAIRERWCKGGRSVAGLIRDFDRIKAALTGEEVFDKTAFFGLHGDLRALEDEMKAAYRPPPRGTHAPP